MRTRALLAATALAVLATLPPGPARAWNLNPSVGTTLSNLPADSELLGTIPDGTGGAFVAWSDLATTYGVRVQRLDARGNTVWIANGIETAATQGNLAVQAALVSDGAGGVIIVTSERRNTPTGRDVFAQRVDASGAKLWGSNGVAVCNLAADQSSPDACSDGAGGVVIVWEDLRSSATLGSDLYAQRVSAAGVPMWTASGVAVVSVAADQRRPKLETDGANGAIVAWEDLRTLAGSGIDIFAQRMQGSNGARLWTASGVSVSSATDDQSDFDTASDGTGGMVLAWLDGRTTTSVSDIYAEQINGAGFLASTLSFVNIAVCTAAGQQSGPRLAEDGQGGVIVAWLDQRLGLGNNQIFAQRLLAGLVPGWAADGVAMQSAPISGFGAFTSTVIPDGFGGGIVTWLDGANIVGQRMSNTGVAQWTTGGVRLQTHFGGAPDAAPCSDGRGGVIVAFSQTRGLTAQDIFAMRVDRYGFYGDTEPVITRVRDVSNDQGGRVKVEWNASYLEFDGFGAVTSYNVFRSVPPALLAAREREGASLTRDVERVVREPDVTLLAANGYAFELVGTVSALDVSAYSFLVSTLGDSIAGSNPPTIVMVQARGGSGRFWSSEPDSGSSVDNLAPIAPVAFAGQYAAGAMRLRWNPNAEPDLAGYRLYRGTSADFPTDATHLVSATTDTTFTDAAGAPYLYKLTAVDQHGNESPVALVGAGATLDATAGAAGPSFAPPSPNPATDRTTIAFALVRASDVRLDLFDAAGRRVRHWDASALPAGAHRRSLELRDDSGRALAPGLYLARFEADGHVQRRSIVVIR